MRSSRPATGTVAALYLTMGLLGYFSLMYVPRGLIVKGDAAATASRIAAGELLWRLGIVSGLLSAVGFLLLAWCLYRVFADVDRDQARLLVLLVAVSTAIGTVSLTTDIAPLVLLSGADFLAPFTRAQLEALAYGSLRVGSGATYLNMVFWGLWLFPFGVLVIKCGFMPRLIGALLIVGCFAYVIVALVALLFPPYLTVVDRVALPFYGVGELSAIIWFVIRAVRGLPLAPISPAPVRA